MEEFDEVNLVEVLDGGYRLKVSEPLTYDHLGETRHFAEGYTVDFRCNVALLSRNGKSDRIPTRHDSPCLELRSCALLPTEGRPSPFSIACAVIVQGNSISELDRHGGHIMLHSRSGASIVDRSQGESLVARIENIEVRRTGQMGRIGRYSIHFHMIGAVRNSYVRQNSIHHTYNRAIAIHGVHYLRVQNNGTRR